VAAALFVWGTLGLIFLVWLLIMLMNVVRLIKVLRLDDEDKPDTRGWIVWGVSVGSLFFQCCVALIAWVVMEWVLKPLDPFEDSLGTIQLFGSARTNVSFVIISNIIFVAVWGLGFGLTR
jgi:hypothetical protein